MKKTARFLTSTVGAAALIGSTAVAAHGQVGTCGDPTHGSRLAQGHHEHRQHLTFAQRKAMIVTGLTRANNRLSTLIDRVSAQAQADPNGWAATALPRLRAKQAKLQTLITAVKAATTQQQIADAFRAAFGDHAGFGDGHRWDRRHA